MVFKASRVVVVASAVLVFVVASARADELYTLDFSGLSAINDRSLLPNGNGTPAIDTVTTINGTTYTSLPHNLSHPYGDPVTGLSATLELTENLGSVAGSPAGTGFHDRFVSGSLAFSVAGNNLSGNLTNTVAGNTYYASATSSDKVKFDLDGIYLNRNTELSVGFVRDGHDYLLDFNDSTSGVVTLFVKNDASNGTLYTLASDDTKEFKVFSGQVVPEPSVALGLCTSLLGLGLIHMRRRAGKTKA